MRRIAFLSPLPPDTSGIADYSAELVPALAAHCEIDLFTADPGAVPEAFTSRFPVRSWDEFLAVDAGARYESVIYQVGNSAEHHGTIYRTLLERPGIVALHEYMLHHLIRDLAVGGGRSAFVEEMRYAYGETGRSMAPRLLTANNLPEMWTYPLFERIVDHAEALIVHSQATRDRVLASRPASRISLVHHHLSLGSVDGPDQAVREALQDQYGIAREAMVIASFGHLNSAKRLDVALRAFARLRRSHPQCVYALVGQPSHAYAELDELLCGELGEGVVTTGRVPLDTLLQFMANCDVAVNLRHPTGGETSGACLRLLGLGRPVIVTEAGWFAEIPNDCCAHVAIDRDEEEMLLAVLTALVEQPELRARLGRNAARWAAEEHRIEDSAAGYARAVEEAITHPAHPTTALPPLARTPPGDMTSALVAGISAALGDVGLSELDPEPARSIARDLVDLEIDNVRG